MNTPTHLLIGAAALARPADDAAGLWRNAAVLLGALVADARIFISYIAVPAYFTLMLG